MRTAGVRGQNTPRDWSRRSGTATYLLGSLGTATYLRGSSGTATYLRAESRLRRASCLIPGAVKGLPLVRPQGSLGTATYLAGVRWLSPISVPDLRSGSLVAVPDLRAPRRGGGGVRRRIGCRGRGRCCPGSQWLRARLRRSCRARHRPGGGAVERDGLSFSWLRIRPSSRR